MKTTLTQIAFVLLAIFSLIGCQNEDYNPTNPLTANAGEPTTGFVGFSSLLDGSLSTNTSNEPTEYEWEVVTKPNGASVIIEDGEQVTAQFEGSLAGEYVIRLTISTEGWQDEDTVKVTLTNDPTPPLIANAGPDRSIENGNPFPLDASSSLIDGQGVQVLWEIASKPESSSIGIQNFNQIVATFNPDKAGEYIFKLTLTMGTLKSQDMVKVTVLDGSSSLGPIIINSDIVQDAVLTNVFVSDPNKLDYLVTRDIMVSGAKLTVEPGVRIGFEEGTGLTIAQNASLKAYSFMFDTAPIIFQGKVAQKGYWDGIKIFSTNPPEYINGIEVRDAGKLGFGIYVDLDAKLYLNHSTIHHNDGVGVSFHPAASISEFKSNKIFDNSISPLRIPANLMTHVSWGNELRNGAIQITEGKILSGLENFWPTFDVPYEALEDLFVYNGSTFSLSSGAHLTMADDKAIRVMSGSILRVLGEETRPVVIEGKTKAKGSWRGIFIENSQARVSSIGFTHIKHAGSNAISGEHSATIKMGDGGNLKIFQTILDEGKGHGLEAIANNVSLQMMNNVIKNHLQNPISVSAPIVEHLDYMTIMSSNGKNEVAVDGMKSLAKDGGEIIWKGFSQRIPYVVGGEGKDLKIKSGMRIKAGVIIKMKDGSRIDVQDADGRLGYLNIEGEAGNPVVIRGVNDTPGSWYGITYSTNHAQNVIQNSEILHAGKATGTNFSAAITVDNMPQGSLLIQNTKIAKSGQHGIAVTKQFLDFLGVSNLSFEAIPGEEILAWE